MGSSKSPFSFSMKRDANLIYCRRIMKGDSIFVPMLAINRDPAIWGADARVFKPERWDAIPEGAHSIPGVWGNTMSFLAGPRACIGYRFSVVE